MKKKVVCYFAVFLVFMLVCTGVSRGIYAYQMPQVETGRAEEKTIEHKIEAEGVLVAVSQKAVTTEEGLLVSEVCVTAGKKVKKGSVLFQVECASLKEKADQISGEIDVEYRRLEDLKNADKKQKKSAGISQKRAAQDVKSTVLKQKENLENAKEEYQEACGKLKEYPSFEAYLNEAREQSTEFQTLKAAAEKPKATQEEKEAFSVFCLPFEAQTKKEWQEGRTPLENEVKEKRKAVASVREQGKKAVKAAKKQAKREIEDMINSQEENGGAVAEEKNVIREKEKQLQKYERLLKEKGKVRSEKAGIIQKINISAGDVTPEGAVMIITDAKEGWNFQAEISKEERSYISEGDSVTLLFREGNIKISDVSITGIKQKSDGSFMLAAFCKNRNLVPGESGVMQLNADSGVEDCCIPLSGLYAAGGENYVLLLTERESFLGKEYRVERRKVLVKDKNEEYAALEGNILGEEDKIVVLCDREVLPGDRVRILEEDA